MTPSKDLFELIKSMSKAEKAHFNRYSQLHASGDQKSYQLLFDAIDKQEEYDEAKLCTQLKEHEFVNYFPVAKNYLYARVLDSLENFQGEMSLSAQVRKTIHKAELLQKKGLYHQSAKLIKKAKKDATEGELYIALLDMTTNLELIIAVENHDFIKSERINNNMLKIFSDLKDVIACSTVASKMLAIWHSYFQTKNKKYLQEADKLIQTPYFIEAAKTKTFKGKQKTYEIYMVYWHIKGKMDLTSLYAKKCLEHYIAHPVQLKRNYMNYVNMLANFCSINMERKKYDEVRMALQKFYEVFHLVKTYSQKARFYYIYSDRMLEYLYKTGNLREIEKKLPVILTDMDTYKLDTNINAKIRLRINIAAGYFYLGNIKKCIFLLNKLRNDNNLSQYPLEQHSWYLLSLIAHNDLGNYDILPYLVQTFYRFLLKKNEMSIMEKSIITFLRKVIRADSEQQSIREFKNFKKTLLHIENDPMYDQAFRTFDIISWLDSKIENRSFTEIVKEKGKLLVRMSSAA